MLNTKHTPFDTASPVRTPLRTHPSLLPLRMALTIAERESPARPPRPITADEKRALELIEKMRTEHNKSISFENFVRQIPTTKDFVLQLQTWEVVEANA